MKMAREHRSRADVMTSPAPPTARRVARVAAVTLAAAAVLGAVSAAVIRRST
jgi:hypothetical protein